MCSKFWTLLVLCMMYAPGGLVDAEELHCSRLLYIAGCSTTSGACCHSYSHECRMLCLAIELCAVLFMQVKESMHHGVPCLRISVPDLPIKSGSDVDLQAVDNQHLLLTVLEPGSNRGACQQTTCQIPLQQAVDVDGIRAKFDQNRHQLVITAPLLQSQPAASA